MIDPHLQDQAALYAAGVMTAGEREQFELILEFHTELRGFTAELCEVAAIIPAASPASAGKFPRAALKARILGLIRETPQQTAPECLVVSGADGRVQWVSHAFSAMCGYDLAELQGKKIGPILQGEKTDRGTAERMRSAVHECRPCRETILNYHKNGTPYWVEIDITPIHDESGSPLWLIAREREMPRTAAA